MRLYYMPGACSLSPHITLREAGYRFELRKVDRQKNIEGGGNYLDINKKGYVPALELADGQLLTEGPAIVQYLADQKPEANLAPPPGTLERARLAEWLGFINSELHKGMSPLFSPKASDEWKAMVRDTVSKRFEFAAQALTERPYLMGEHISVADPYLFVVLRWARSMGLDVAKSHSLTAFYNRVAARPKVQEALVAEGLEGGAK